MNPGFGRRRRRVRLLSSLLLLAAAPSAAEWLVCPSELLWDASGYPGLKRKYHVSQHCFYSSSADHSDSEAIKSGVEFSVDGFLEWDGTTGAMTENVDLKGKNIQGGALEIAANCKFDPFLEGSGSPVCQDVQWKGEIDPRILSALVHGNSMQFFFHRVVNPEQALVLSKKKESGSTNPPPPPPAPAPKIPSGQKQPGSPAKTGEPIVPVPASGQKNPAGPAGSSGGVLVLVTPTPGGAPAADRLRLPAQPTPVPGRGGAVAAPPPRSRIATSPTPTGGTADSARRMPPVSPTSTPTAPPRRRS